MDGNVLCFTWRVCAFAYRGDRSVFFTVSPNHSFSFFCLFCVLYASNNVEHQSKWARICMARVTFFFNHFYFPSLTRTGKMFYPQRSSGQAVVTGVVPSPPRYVLFFLSHMGFRIPTARRFPSNVANTLSRFPLIIFLCKKKPRRACTR